MLRNPLLFFLVVKMLFTKKERNGPSGLGYFRIEEEVFFSLQIIPLFGCYCIEQEMYILSECVHDVHCILLDRI